MTIPDAPARQAQRHRSRSPRPLHGLLAAWLLPWCVVVAAQLATPALARAQRATLVGTVTDQAGAPVGTVTVILTALDAEAERQTVTGPDGSYTLGGLVPGRYRVRIEEANFELFTTLGLALTGGERRTLDITLLALGAAPAEPETPLPPLAPPPTERFPNYTPTPDRWRIELPGWQRYPRELEGEFPYTEGRPLDPYNLNPLKGDVPVIGDDIFFVLTARSETPFEYRSVPTPGGISTERPDTEPFFAEGEQWTVLPTAFVTLELFKGDTAFKPRDWAVRVTPVFNLNYNSSRERNVFNIDPEEGNTRRRQDFALEEAFAEVKLFDVSENYDFVSVRGGIQPFSSDFRGFLFFDTNLGVRAFGNWGNNKNQWNVAYFDQLEKETNSELNLLERRNQQVFIANWYRQDFLTLGYTISPSFHANIDKGEEFFFDENGFLVRPAPIGLIEPHQVKAYYVGFGGDGHWGRLNISHQFYQAFGEDEFNGISGRPVDINAQFAAVELSVDKDWWRLKGSFLWASGDDDPDDDRARGFDSIFDSPNIGGGPFSFWNREALRLTQTFVGLVGRESVLPSLRSSKTEGQANFVNPGLFLYNIGWDAALTTKLKTSVNLNYLRFDKTEVLERVLFQSEIDKSIGLDYSIGFEWRPWLNDNVILLGGVAFLTPGAGFKNLLTDKTLYSPFAVLTVTY